MCHANHRSVVSFDVDGVKAKTPPALAAWSFNFNLRNSFPLFCLVLIAGAWKSNLSEIFRDQVPRAGNQD